MNKKHINDNKVEKLIVFFYTFVVLGIAIWNYLNMVSYNKVPNITKSGETGSKPTVTLEGRDSETGSWIKRDYDLYGEKVDLIANTYDGVLRNDGRYIVNKWSLRINITKDCFINQMWNGTVEIHQFNKGFETVQKLDLASYNLDDVKLKKLYDGDLLIPLHKGDYFIYYPSPKFKEDEVKRGESITFGAIFYFLDDIEFDDFTLEYYYSRTFIDGPLFGFMFIFGCLWAFLLFKLIIENSVYKKAQKEMEFKNKLERAEMEAQAKSAFLANMSHEIRTPINTVIGLDTMILRETNEPEIKKYAKDIKNASQMLLSLVNGVLDSSKLEAGKMELIKAEYSLKQLVFDIWTLTKKQIEDKSLDYKIEIAKDIPDKLVGDDVRLKQIIINLLTNATKYTDTGSVTLSVKGKRVEGNVCLTFSVKDTGMGIKKEDYNILLERFQRLEEKKNRNVEGTGLGLGLVQGILGLMNSKLEFESEYGKGSNFHFDVMQDVVSEAQIGEVDFEHMEVNDDDDNYRALFVASKAKILVVDDNTMNLMVFEKLLKETKIQITKATSGAEALKHTKNEKFDLIFMDHMMPEMDGIEAFKRIRAQEDGKNTETPVIVLTANALQGAKEEYDRIGFNDFLPKPIKPEILEGITFSYLPKDLIEKDTTSRRETKKVKMSEVQIEGIDFEYATQHAGTTDGAIEIMKNFVKLADEESGELNLYFNQLLQNRNDSNAIDSYRIKVHAMKTSAGFIGALQLYGTAAFLEMAARDLRVNEVVAVTQLFLEFWNKTKTNVSNFLDTLKIDNAEKKILNKDNVRNLLHQLNTSMKSYDFKTADLIIEELNKYDFGLKTSALEQLQVAVSKLDNERIEELSKQLLD